MRVKGSDWTGRDIKMIKEMWSRRRKGEPTSKLAAELDLTPTHLSKLWRQFGMDPDTWQKRERRFKHTDTSSQVHSWRVHEGISYKECCERLGMEPTTENAHRMRNRHWRFCQRARAPWPGGDRVGSNMLEAEATGVDLRKQGLSYRQIAPHMGIPAVDWKKVYGRLRRFCKNENLPWPIPVNYEEA